MNGKENFIPDLPGEQWREVRDAPGYFVSNMGRVLGKRGALLKPVITAKDTYPRVSIHGGKSKNFKVHNLVLSTFVCPRPEGMQARHLNGDKTDARLENLIWGTATENGADRICHGTQASCDKNGGAKLTWEQVEIICATYDARTGAQKWGALRLAREFGVSHTTIGRIGQRKLWTKEPPIPTGNGDTDKGEGNA